MRAPILVLRFEQKLRPDDARHAIIEPAVVDLGSHNPELAMPGVGSKIAPQIATTQELSQIILGLWFYGRSGRSDGREIVDDSQGTGWLKDIDLQEITNLLGRTRRVSFS